MPVEDQDHKAASGEPTGSEVALAAIAAMREHVAAAAAADAIEKAWNGIRFDVDLAVSEIDAAPASPEAEA